MTTSLAGLRGARIVAQRHMRTRVEHGGMWDERTVTHLLLAEAHEVGQIRYAEFTQPEEREVGADWIWWFIDRSNECFGMLVQAKTLSTTNGRNYRINFGYRKSEQITRLCDNAKLLGVPPVYVLYCGDVTYRSSLGCTPQCEQPLICDECERKSVAVLPGIIAHKTMEYDRSKTARIAYQFASPLESIGEPAPKGRRLYLAWADVTDPALKSFLTRPQSGARGIAKSILEQVLRMRMGHASAITGDGVDARANAVFHEYPEDRGHFSVPYMPHVLDGLRSSPPEYVSMFIESGNVPDAIVQTARGIVVVYV